MLDDPTGLPKPLTDPDAAAAWEATQRAFLAHGAATPDHLGRTLAAAPDFAVGHAAKGLFYLLLGRAELLPTAHAAYTSAKLCAEEPRCLAYVEVLEHYLNGRLAAAAKGLDAILARWPGDTLAMKLAHQIYFVRGDAKGMRASLEAALPGFGPDHPMRGYFLGCTAFALEETGDYRAAEAAGRAGLEINTDDAWGLHAVAHVHDMTGRADAGVRWLTDRTGQWEHCNNFGFHVWWHLALFHLDKGNFGAVLDLYDRRIRCSPTDDYRDIANAASLLLRLELEGVDVASRWEELADLAQTRIDDGQVIFADLHYMLALVRSDRAAEAERLSARIARDAQRLDHDQHEVAAIAGLPAARGLCAFRAGENAQAVDALEQALGQLQRVGGSHAQRDVFWRLTVEAAIRAGALGRAEGLLRRRASERGAEDGYTARTMARIANLRTDLSAGGVAAQ
ncbi:MAG: tetratricopeptide repeat protein [Pseudomonadota bacterium]